ncbi:MAG: hypothetical protein JJV95_05680 [Sulfurospirillum sp.]|nr:hypothetical protein [Sulfurospirillum sp.]
MQSRKHRREKYKRYKQLEQSNIKFEKFTGWGKLKKYENNKKSRHSKHAQHNKKNKLLKQQGQTGVILLPENIDFKDHIDNIEILISKFKYSMQLSSTTIKINLSKLNYISINGLLYLISEIAILQNKKFKQKFNTTKKFKYNSKYGVNKNNNKLKYLLHAIGYWDYFGIKRPYSIDETTKNKYFLSIKSDTLSRSHYVADLRDFISEKVNFFKTEEIQDYFDDAITEAMANSVEHGYIKNIRFRTKGKWWLCGHYDKNANYLEFSFRDYGVGLRKTLEYNSNSKIKSLFRIVSNTQISDSSIIKLLVNDKLPKYKGKKDKIRGYGFKRFKEFAKNIGYNCEMKIISGDGKYDYSYLPNTDKETETLTDNNFKIRGFLISWKIYLGDNNETNN